MRPRYPPPPLEVGTRYVAGARLRWILAIANGHVLYSRGGDRHMECQIKTFQRWLRKGRVLRD